MRDLENEIARLQLRSEQVLIHLQHLPFGSREASAVRRNLGRMARRLVALKGERDQRLRELEMPPTDLGTQVRAAADIDAPRGRGASAPGRAHPSLAPQYRSAR